MKAKNPPELSNVDPTPLPICWLPVLTMDEAGDFLAALTKDPAVRPADFCRDEGRKAACPVPVSVITLPEV